MKIPNVKLTVIIKDESPFICQQEPILHRTVHVNLTEGQLKELALYEVGKVGKTPIFESISQAFLEDVERH